MHEFLRIYELMDQEINRRRANQQNSDQQSASQNSPDPSNSQAQRDLSAAIEVETKIRTYEVPSF